MSVAQACGKFEVRGAAKVVRRSTSIASASHSLQGAQSEGEWLLRRVLDRYLPRHLFDRQNGLCRADRFLVARSGLGGDAAGAETFGADNLLPVEAVRRAWAHTSRGTCN
jgi:hypothetical protein